MKEWNVYLAGRYIGTVHAKDEDEAKLAAIYKFNLADNANPTVYER